MYEMYQSSVDSKEKSKQLQNQMNVIKGILLVLRAINSGNETNIWEWQNIVGNSD